MASGIRFGSGTASLPKLGKIQDTDGRRGWVAAGVYHPNCGRRYWRPSTLSAASIGRSASVRATASLERMRRAVNWSGFGPALLSTFLGAALAAVLAIPAGLFLDRAQLRRTARKDVQQAASIRSKALGANAERLAALAGTLGRKADIIEELLELELDAETWETVRTMVGEHLPVDVAASLSRHFSAARWVERAVEVLIRGCRKPGTRPRHRAPIPSRGSERRSE